MPVIKGDCSFRGRAVTKDRSHADTEMFTWCFKLGGTVALLPVLQLFEESAAVLTSTTV